MLQLLADEEVATVTAGPEAQQQAADKLQAAQAALAAVDQVCVLCALIQHGHLTAVTPFRL